MDNRLLPHRKLLFLLLCFILNIAEGERLFSQGMQGERYIDEVFDSVFVTPDLQYGEAYNFIRNQWEILRLDLYEPVGDTVSQRPVIIWVHGGGFVSGDKRSENMVALCTVFAKKGYVTASINYRLHEGYIAEDDTAKIIEATTMAYEDTKAAIRWFRANASTYRIDTNRIAVAGGSAGAFAALHATYEEPEGQSGNPGYSSEVSGCIDIAGALVDDTILEPGEAPVMIVHGTNDERISFLQALEIRDRAEQVGVPYEFYPLQGAGHEDVWLYTPFIIEWSTYFLYEYVIQGMPHLSISDTTVSESDSVAYVPVTLVPAREDTVVVQYSTADSTAQNGLDYTAVQGEIRFDPGDTVKFVVVPLIDDDLDENDEIFTLTLFNPRRASISKSTALCTLRDDDPPPLMRIEDASITEGDTSASHARFRVLLSQASAKEITVFYETLDSTAVAGLDYETSSGNLLFSPGDTAHTVSVPIEDDSLDESDEYFYLRLSQLTNAMFEDSLALCVIEDDDPMPSISINDVHIAEKDSGWTWATFTVWLSRISGREIVLNYATEDSTAEAGEDYEATSGTVSLAPGDSLKEIQVKIFGDTLQEPDELFTLILSNPIHVQLLDSVAIGVIIDDDTAAVQLDWTFSLTVFQNQQPDSIFRLIIGGDEEATDGFDVGMDQSSRDPDHNFFVALNNPMPPPQYLTQDIRFWEKEQPPDIQWQIDILNAEGIQYQIQWNAEELPGEGNFFLQNVQSGLEINLRERQTLVHEGNATFLLQYLPDECITYRFDVLEGGWYLISLPVRPQDRSLNHLFPEAAALFSWKFSGQVYTADSTLETGKAYWLLMMDTATVQICGAPISGFTKSYNQQGWDMIGSAIQPAAVIDDPEGSIISMYRWQTNPQGYAAVSPHLTRPGQGYWIFIYSTPVTVRIEQDSAMTQFLTSFAKNAQPQTMLDIGRRPPPPPFELINKDQQDGIEYPTSHKLYQSFPNPFSEATVIRYYLARPGHVNLTIYDVLGRLITTLLDQPMEKGYHRIFWNGRNHIGDQVGSGIYIYKLEVDETLQTGKVLYLKQ